MNKSGKGMDFELKQTINNIQDFLTHLSIPKSCELNKPVFKKMFLDSGALNTTDKACLKEDVDKIRWLYTLKPSTINIAAYADDQRDYSEIAVLLVELASPKRIMRIAQFMQRSIPYPLVLIFTCNIEGQENLTVSLADKRINQADKEKWVVEDSIQTGWISLEEESELDCKFLNSLTISNFSYSNFLNFYKCFTERVIAINCAEHSGQFTLEDGNEVRSGDERLVFLREIEKLHIEKSEISNRLKKIKQMGRQVELNTQIKQINDKVELLKSRI